MHCTCTYRLQTLSDFMETPMEYFNDQRSDKVYALDCEMVYGVWGFMLGRVTLVDSKNKVVLDIIVKPEHKVIDPNTRFSGLTMNDLSSSKCSLYEVSFFLLVFFILKSKMKINKFIFLGSAKIVRFCQLPNDFDWAQPRKRFKIVACCPSKCCGHKCRIST